MKRVTLFVHTLILIISTSLLAPLGSAQTEMTPEQKEAAKQQFNKAIEERVVKVLSGIEITEEQLKPMQLALVQYFAPVQIEMAKMRAERQKMQAEGGGRGNMDRQAMMQRRNKLEKLRTDTDKKVKGILDKKQYKAYQAAMEELMPQQRGRPGGGGGGGGRGGR